MSYKAIIFDMDGTLIDSFDGIYNSYAYACAKLNIPKPDEILVKSLIGYNLKFSFINHFSMNNETADIARSIFRKYYRTKGYKEYTFYNGIVSLLKILNEKGFKIGIATLKKSEFALKILEENNLLKYIGTCNGIEGNDKITKADLIIKCINDFALDKNDILYVGDTKNDLNSAIEAGVDFVAALYGFGFQNVNFLEREHVFSISKPLEILEILK